MNDDPDFDISLSNLGARNTELARQISADLRAETSKLRQQISAELGIERRKLSQQLSSTLRTQRAALAQQLSELRSEEASFGHGAEFSSTSVMSGTISEDPAIQDSFRKAVTDVKQLINTELKRVCKEEGLPVSGIKSALQSRIIQRIQLYADTGDKARLAAISHSISPNKTYVNSTSGYAPTAAYLNQPSSSTSTSASNMSLVPIRFRDDILRSISSMVTSMTLQRLPAAQHTQTVSFPLSAGLIELLKDPNHRIMIYSSSDFLSPDPICSFPSSIRIEVNGTVYDKNLRAIKKKSAGPVNPADITDLIRKHPSYINKITVTYGSTTTSYGLVVNIVKKHSITELVDKVQKGSRIPKARTIAEFRRQEDDAEIEAISTDMSLKDPSTGMRITLPVKTTACSHAQCFDAEGFFLLQEQSPQTQCSRCNAPIRRLTDLAVDEYMTEILNSVNDSVDQVTINPDGSYRAKGSHTEPQPHSKKKQRISYNLDEEDEEDNKDSLLRDLAANNAPSWAPRPDLASPSLSREPSSAVSAAASSSNKRKSEVVDLTLSSSDDDDDPPRPAIKRTSTSVMNGMNGGGVQLPSRLAAVPSPSLPSPWGQYQSPDPSTEPWAWPRG